MLSHSFSNGVLQGKIKIFSRDARGNIAILFALFLVPALVLMGLAIDSLRALNAAETAQNALDASVLATARAMSQQDLSDAELNEIAERYFRANIEGAGKVSYSHYGSLDVSANRQSGEVTATVSTRVATTLGQLAKIDQFNMVRSATAVYKQTDLEVGLMLDVTGSMGGQKIRDLKLAASDLVEMLIPERANGNGARIGLAPYAASVNAGPYKSSVTEPDARRGRFSLAGFGGFSRGDDCVVEREGAHAYDDTAPGHNAWLGTHPDPAFPVNSKYDCPESEVVPLTSDRRALLRSIDRFRANGYTAGHIGVAWSWYLVSPEWSAIWPSASRPEPYGTRNLVKAVVLMTDGEFNTSYRNGRLNDSSNDQAEELCERMKDKDVVVFTVGFDLHERNAIRTLERCATSGSHHYLAGNGEDLRKAFRDIGVKLSKLRISS